MSVQAVYERELQQRGYQSDPAQLRALIEREKPDLVVPEIEAIATAKAREAGVAAAGEKFGELSKTVDEVINDIVDTKARSHFEKIADAHPDFNEIGASEEFKTYVDSLPDDQKGAAMETIANGNARSIIKLLDGFKAANVQGAKDGAAPSEGLTEAQGESIVDEAFEDSALDAAEGVRSSGMKLPEEPKAGGNYEDAWNDF